MGNGGSGSSSNDEIKEKERNNISNHSSVERL